MSGVAMSYDLFVSDFRRDNTEGHVIRNSLAGLLGATNRLDEAEQLLRQSLEMFFEFTRAIGHPHSSLQGALKNYAELLQIMDRSEEQVFATLHELTPRVLRRNHLTCIFLFFASSSHFKMALPTMASPERQAVTDGQL
jgi:hypothetical protein